MKKNTYQLMNHTNALGHFRFLKMFGTKLRTESLVRTAAFAAIAVGVVGVYLWRCQFGLDLTDEAFYLAGPWKLFALGDRPFTHEIYNGVRHSDFLNYLFVKPFVGFSVLKLRWAAVLLYSTILLAFLLTSFRNRVGLVAGCTFVVCLTYDYFLMPTWSYNWWARNLLLVHHVMILAYGRSEAKHREFYFAGAGAALGLAVVAYNSLFPAIPLAALTLGLGYRFFAKLKSSRHVGLYLAGASVVIGADAIYCLAHFGDWLLSVRSMSSMNEYSRFFVFEKIWNIVRYIVSLPELYFLLLITVRLTIPPKWMVASVRKKVERWFPRARLWLALPCTAFVAMRFWFARDVGMTMDAYVSLGLAAGIILLLRSSKDRDPWLLMMTVTSLLVTLGIAVSSTNQWLALFWGLPGLIIPFVAMQTLDMDEMRRRKGADELVEPFSRQLMLRVFLVFIAYGCFQFQRTTTYYDVPPGNCVTPVTVEPLKGIKTSERRAFLTEELHRLVGNANFVLAFADIPGPFYFGKARPAADTVIVEAEAPYELHQRSLRRMAERNRIPDLVIRAKVHPWYWGIQHPLARVPMKYPVDDPYSRFAHCARTKTLVDYEEFEAFEIDRAKVKACVTAATS